MKEIFRLIDALTVELQTVKEKFRQSQRHADARRISTIQEALENLKNLLI